MDGFAGMIILTLPWPDADLSPNSRNRWGKINAALAARRDAARIMAAQPHGDKLPSGPLAVNYFFYPPSRRWYDDDNLIAMMKSWRDGIFDFWGTNDHAVVFTTGRRCEVRKGGAVEVRIGQDKRRDE